MKQPQRSTKSQNESEVSAKCDRTIIENTFLTFLTGAQPQTSLRTRIYSLKIDLQWPSN